MLIWPENLPDEIFILYYRILKSKARLIKDGPWWIWTDNDNAANSNMQNFMDKYGVDK
jgi:hypothetical protein